MIITHLTYGLSLGGIETMLVNIANEQVHQEHFVNIIVVNDLVDKELVRSIDKRIKLYYLNRRIGSKSLFPFLRLNFLLIRLHSDVVHIHTSNLINRLAKLFLTKNIVATMHTIPNEEDADNLKQCKKVCAISKSVKEELNKYGVNSTIIYNGIHAEKFQPKDEYRNSSFRIVQIGRLLYDTKGQDVLINAIAELVGQGITNIHTDMIGNGVSFDFLKEMITNKNIGAYISFLGAKSQSYIAEHLKDYSLFVQPSRREGFGLTVAEAMASKLPVLVSDQQGP